jgi:hypothetical protein
VYNYHSRILGEYGGDIMAAKTQSAIKRFVGNKNVVTILGIALCIGILVLGYFIRVNNSVTTTSIPFAKKELSARNIIGDGDVGNVRISQSYVTGAGNVITSAQEVYGKAVAYYSNIPAGSLFYSTSIMDPEELPNASFKDIGQGNTIFSLTVDNNKTYSNSIRPGDYIDLYMSTDDPFNEGSVVFGCFIESIRVLGVKNDFGKNILKNGTNYGSPNQLLFSVDNEYFLLLKDAEFLDIDLVPVLHNAAYTQKGTKESTKVSSEYLRSIITSKLTTEI